MKQSIGLDCDDLRPKIAFYCDELRPTTATNCVQLLTSVGDCFCMDADDVITVQDQRYCRQLV